MKRIKVTAEFDKAKAKAVKKALRDLPPQFRGRQIIKAQKEIMKPAKDEVVRVLRSEINSTSLTTRSVQVVQGKYAKKTSPYVVVQTADKARMARRFREKYSTSTMTNFWKIDHILAMGSGNGTRTAGQSVRQATGGRKRVKLYDPSGNPTMINRPTQGRYFLVQGGGKLHPIKQINHPGTVPIYHYDKALRKTNAQARNKFYDYVAAQITEYKRKTGLE